MGKVPKVQVYPFRLQGFSSPAADLALGGIEIGADKDDGQRTALEFLVVMSVCDLRNGLAGGLVEFELEDIDGFVRADIGVDTPRVCS